MISHLHSAYGPIGTTECGAANHTPFAKTAAEATCPLCLESAKKLKYPVIAELLSNKSPRPKGVDSAPTVACASPGRTARHGVVGSASLPLESPVPCEAPVAGGVFGRRVA